MRAIRTQIAAFLALPATLIIALSALFCLTGETDVAIAALAIGVMLSLGALLVSPPPTHNRSLR